MKQKERGKYDQNFDPLIDKFKARIYSGIKGEWRLKLLREDLQELHQKEPMEIWDAGCGLGQLALWFAKAGHTLTCCDISYKMLEAAKQSFNEAKVDARFEKLPAQQMALEISQQDLVIFHAVIEWLADPLVTLSVVSERVKPGGHLSLLFFNYHSFVFRNTLRGGWCVPFVGDESAWYGKGKKLTPPYPQKPEVMKEWLKAQGYEIRVQTGIRVFHDYMQKEVLEDTDLDALMALEYRYCREPIYCDMGRYIHILAKKTYAQ